MTFVVAHSPLPDADSWVGNGNDENFLCIIFTFLFFDLVPSLLSVGTGCDWDPGFSSSLIEQYASTESQHLFLLLVHCPHSCLVLVRVLDKRRVSKISLCQSRDPNSGIRWTNLAASHLSYFNFVLHYIIFQNTQRLLHRE